MVSSRELSTWIRRFASSVLVVTIAVLVLAAAAAAAPQNPNRGNFCSGYDVTTTAVYANSPDAGATVSSVINIPSSGGIVGIYIRNNGTTDLAIQPAPFFTVLGGPIPPNTNTSVPTVPPGGGAVFNDFNFSFFQPPLHPSEDVVGCVLMSPGTGTVHLNLTLTRGSTNYTELIKVAYQQ